MAMPPVRLIHRDDLRLAVSIGVAAGLGSISSVPDGYYLPLTLAAVMAGSYGSSYSLGIQRVICTLLGAIVLLISQPALALLPFPFGLALVLGVIRLVGGLLGLQAGYKIAGLVVIMGWTMQSGSAIDTWLGLKIGWTALGVLLALLSLHVFWPSTAIRDQHRSFQDLLAIQREALLHEQSLLEQGGGRRMLPAERKQRHRQQMQALLQLQATRSAAVTELGANPYSQSLFHLWQELERCCVALAGCITALRALREPNAASSTAMQALHEAEVALLAGCVDQLSVWIDALQREPLFTARRSWTVASPLRASMQLLRVREQALFEHQEPCRITPGQWRQVARRCLLCYQVAAMLERMQQRWLELATNRHPDRSDILAKSGILTNRDRLPAPP